MKIEREVLNGDLELIKSSASNTEHNIEQSKTILAKIIKTLDEAEFNRLTKLLNEYT